MGPNVPAWYDGRMGAELLKTDEVARLLRVHPKHVYRLIARGLPGRRVGSEWRFVRDEVLAWSSSRGSPREVARAADERPSVEPTPRARRNPASDASTGHETPPLLGANGDVVVDVLLSRVVAEKKPLVGFVRADRSTALAHLGARSILLAGYHGDAPPMHFDAERLARVHLVRREVGLAHGRSLAMKRLADLAKKRLATRPPTAGLRVHFDHALAAEGLSLARMGVISTTFDAHRDAVLAVVRGEADAALTTSAWASKVGLRFFPLAEESYDLLLFADSLGHRSVVGLCEVAQSKAFRDELRRVPGYDARRAGEIRYTFDG